MLHSLFLLKFAEFYLFLERIAYFIFFGNWYNERKKEVDSYAK